MKKYELLITSIVVLVLSFLNSWFSDELLDSLFIFVLIPNLVLFIGWIICLVFSIINLIRYKRIINVVSLIIVVLTALLILFFPFRETKGRLELNLYENERLEIIKMVEDKKLKTDEFGNVDLPYKYKKISTSGEVFVFQNDEEGQAIGFWMFRGKLFKCIL